MTDRQDFYKVLQVDPEADPEVIQAAHRRLAQKFHPDLAEGPDANARMVAINEAWHVLSSPERRAAYDAERARPVGGFGGPPGAPPHPTPPPAPGAPAQEAPGGATPATGAAGPPPGKPSGSVLNFGRYSGWSLGEIVRRDPEYLEWLERMSIGRIHRDEIDSLLRKTGRRKTDRSDEGERRGLFRRR